MNEIIQKAGWADAAQTPITPDWSPRQFWRLTKPDGSTAVLMHAAREIPGHSLDEFARLAERLRVLGLSAPKVYAELPGWMIIEDFGDTPIDTPAIEREAYEAAVDVLAVFRRDQSQRVKYKDGYIYKKLALFSDDPGWIEAWETAEASLQQAPDVFAHMDYKAGNLHWLPGRDGVKRIGLLDFQAAQRAPFVYDIVNLLEDARRDIDPALKAHLKSRFKNALPDHWKDLFDDWYVLMAAQFHARVLGQIRGNPKIAPDVEPRLRAYLASELQAAALGPVRDWGQKTGLLI